MDISSFRGGVTCMHNSLEWSKPTPCDQPELPTSVCLFYSLVYTQIYSDIPTCLLNTRSSQALYNIVDELDIKPRYELNT